MKALSIRQPWAWLIVNGHKDIENRDWVTNLRGPFLVHASKTMTTHEYNDVRGFLLDTFPHIKLPLPEHLPKGGIVGKAEITGCVTESRSRFFFGKYGFTLANAKPLPFRPYRGMLQFFDIPEALSL